MSAPRSPRQQYADWIEERLEDHKSALTRGELLALADQAITGLLRAEDGQYPLTEILLRDAVDTLIFERLHLPTYRQWLRTCQTDTSRRTPARTIAAEPDRLLVS